MGLHGPVLAATDLSDAADAVLRQAHEIAADLTAPLIVCHVLPETFSVRVLFPQDAGVDTSFLAELERKATSAVRTRLDTVLGASAESVPIQIETGTAHAGILTIAERVGAGVIVLGPGPAAQRVARSSTGPVLVARPSPTGGGVLAATDFSDPSLPAIHMGADEAKRRGARFRVIHCLDLDKAAYLGTVGAPGMMAIAPLPPAVFEQLATEARERLSEALGRIGAVSEAVVVHGGPIAGILEAADAVATALIVVGTRGRTGLARIALGSIAESVISHATCSVLAVPLHPA